MNRPIKVLMLEDVPTDAELITRSLKKDKLDITTLRVETEPEFEQALLQFAPDVILSDYSLPTFDGISALKILKQKQLDIPFIFVTGTIGEQQAAEVIKLGATDFLLKDRLSRLSIAIQKALETQHLEQAKYQAEQALQDSEAFYREVLSSLPAHVAVIDKNGTITAVNQSWEHFAAANGDESLNSTGVGINYLEVCQRAVANDPSVQYTLNGIESVLNGGQDGFQLEYRCDPDEPQRWFEMRVTPLVSHLAGAVISHQDITLRKFYQQQLEHQANNDVLTGLPNRNLLHDRIEQLISLMKRTGQKVAVMLLDLDNFKHINDSLGHDAGDRLLIEIARRLNQCIRQSDTLARYTGDEFVIVVSGDFDEEHLNGLIQRMLQTVSDPVSMHGHTIIPSCSLGLSFYPDDGENSNSLLRSASTAMYHAKKTGRNTFQRFMPTLHVQASKRLQLESDLGQALALQQFELNYQPQVGINSGRIIGMEALIRWRHPQKGWISPVYFIPLAEELGLINPIGEWVLQTACQQSAHFQQLSPHPVPVSVNLSAHQFQQIDLFKQIVQSLQSAQLESRLLELELTESAIMSNPEEITQTLKQLQNIGIQISLDDFGTGYSSLSYLARFPVNRIKIDRSFINGFLDDHTSRAIVQSIVTLGHSLRLSVIAEGVENTEQLMLLREINCHEVQGYYFCKPLPADELIKLLPSGTIQPDSFAD